MSALNHDHTRGCDRTGTHANGPRDPAPSTHPDLPEPGLTCVPVPLQVHPREFPEFSRTEGFSDGTQGSSAFLGRSDRPTCAPRSTSSAAACPPAPATATPPPPTARRGHDDGAGGGTRDRGPGRGRAQGTPPPDLGPVTRTPNRRTPNSPPRRSRRSLPTRRRHRRRPAPALTGPAVGTGPEPPARTPGSPPRRSPPIPPVPPHPTTPPPPTRAGPDWTGRGHRSRATGPDPGQPTAPIPPIPPVPPHPTPRRPGRGRGPASRRRTPHHCSPPAATAAPTGRRRRRREPRESRSRRPGVRCGVGAAWHGGGLAVTSAAGRDRAAGGARGHRPPIAGPPNWTRR